MTELTALCAGLREVVQPFLGLHAARRPRRRGRGRRRDLRDRRGRRALPGRATWRARLPRWAYYSEDRGLQGATDPELVLIVDPIDGTRPAAAGFESACVSIAAARPAATPTMAELVAGVVQEIKTGDLFAAERGGGLVMRRAAGAPLALLPSPRTTPRGPVLEHRLSRPAAPAAVAGHRRARRRVERGRRRVRARLGDLRHHPRAHRAARRLRRHRSGDHRRAPRHRGRVPARGQRPRALQLALRPGRGLAAVPRGRRAHDRRRRRRRSGGGRCWAATPAFSSPASCRATTPCRASSSPRSRVA